MWRGTRPLQQEEHMSCHALNAEDVQLTPCLSRGRQLRGEANTQPPPLGYNQLQSGEAWNGGPQGPDSSHSEGCKVAERQRELTATSPLQRQVLESNSSLPAPCPGLLLWLPPGICSPHRSSAWEHFLHIYELKRTVGLKANENIKRWKDGY